MINADKPKKWKADITASVDFYNEWFMTFAPVTFRTKRVEATAEVKKAVLQSKDLTDITPELLETHPYVLATFRMCCCPPLARERLAGLAGVNKTLLEKLEEGGLPKLAKKTALKSELGQIMQTISKLLDFELFPWLEDKRKATAEERDWASTIVADRRCGAVSDPIIRNEQEKRQISKITAYLLGKKYVAKPLPAGKLLTEMEPGTFSIRMVVSVGTTNKVKIPIDVVIQPRKPRWSKLPLLIEAKSAGDFTNVNKRRKEEAKKMDQLRKHFGDQIEYILFLCGYFNTGYLGYEAPEGMDWIWEHRLTDLDQLGL